MLQNHSLLHSSARGEWGVIHTKIIALLWHVTPSLLKAQIHWMFMYVRHWQRSSWKFCSPYIQKEKIRKASREATPSKPEEPSSNTNPLEPARWISCLLLSPLNSHKGSLDQDYYHPWYLQSVLPSRFLGTVAALPLVPDLLSATLHARTGRAHRPLRPLRSSRAHRNRNGSC